MSTIIEEFITVDGLPTFVTKAGELTKDTNVIALVIPGNPGVADYYNEYAVELHSASGVPVWCISHAGHVKPPADKSAMSPDSSQYFKLRGQIEHKLRLIDEHIPYDVKLILIGHSIGSYIILHMLEMLPRDRVVLCPLLFLTIERMASSPKGTVTTPLLKYCRWMIPFLMLPVSLIPSSIHNRLIQWYFGQRPVHDGVVTATARLVNTYSLRNITNMANEEMQTVDIPDYHLLQRHRHKLWFYYGANDHWCPVNYYFDMIRRYPDADITLCQHGFEHAFCLEASKQMATLTWEKLKHVSPRNK